MKNNIKCSISKKEYSLTPMITEEEKFQGLKKYPIGADRDGLIFVYVDDTDRGFTFAAIHHCCVIYFLDKNLNIIKKEQTTPYQKRIVTCPKKYRYVIEILHGNR